METAKAAVSDNFLAAPRAGFSLPNSLTAVNVLFKGSASHDERMNSGAMLEARFEPAVPVYSQRFGSILHDNNNYFRI
jgi:hypothetical protein